MKYLFSVTALVGAVMAQTLQDLPSCGQNCIAGMLAAAPALGCGASDAACLCSNIRFGYGIRDCVDQSCPSGTNTQQILQYGLGYCQGVASSASAAGSTVVLSATQALGGGSGSGNGNGNGASATGGTVVPVVTTIVSDGTSMTSIIGSTTIFGSGSGNGGATSSGASGSGASASASSAASGASASGSSASESASSRVSEINSSASSEIASATSHASSASHSASGSGASGSGSGSSSGNAAPIATMAVQGAAGLVGLAAVMLL